jgi:hypothetical protein
LKKTFLSNHIFFSSHLDKSIFCYSETHGFSIDSSEEERDIPSRERELHDTRNAVLQAGGTRRWMVDVIYRDDHGIYWDLS